MVKATVKKGAPAPKDATDKSAPTGSVKPRTVMAVMSAASTGALGTGPTRSQAMIAEIEAAMSKAIMDGIKDGLPMDSPKLRQRQLDAREAVLVKYDPGRAKGVKKKG